MKKSLAILIATLLGFSIHAKEVVSFNDLKQGDTFSFQITVPFKGIIHRDVWNFSQAQKIDVDFQVLSVEKDSVRLGIMPTNWLICFQDHIYLTIILLPLQ